MRARAGAATLLLASAVAVLIGQNPETVRPIPAPAAPLPPEADTAGITRFSFLVYGDTRSRHDGVYVQPDHMMVAEGMLDAVKRLASTPYPVRFVLSSGDGVVDGRQVRMWNRSFLDVVSRLTQEGGVSYFMAPGNHDVTSAPAAEAPGRAEGLRNFLALNANFIPAEGTPRRLNGFPTYAFGYGNTFFIALDSNVAADDRQTAWVKAQLEGLDRRRFPNIIVFCHHPVFSSGPHGAIVVEASTAALRSTYMPLFNAHHVAAVFAGHEHLFEHWVERYQDVSGAAHRMDLVVTGGGGAPPYAYMGEPETRTFNVANHATLEHLVKPGPDPGDNPYHFVIVRVDGTSLSLDVIGVDWGRTFKPYRSNTTELR